MRSKAPLALIEQTVMALVFALAAALCLRAFVWSDTASLRSQARDQAVLKAQTAAEVIKGSDGDTAQRLSAAAASLDGSYEQGLFWVDYDEDWQPDPQADAYRLTAQGVASQVPGLGKAVISVVSDGSAGLEPDVLFQLEIAWQEVVP